MSGRDIMYLVEEYCGSLYLKDASTRGVITELTEPAVSFSHYEGTFVLRRIGNKETVVSDYESLMSKAFAAGLEEMAQEYFWMELPKDVALLNNLYNNASYLSVVLHNLNWQPSRDQLETLEGESCELL